METVLHSQQKYLFPKKSKNFKIKKQNNFS